MPSHIISDQRLQKNIIETLILRDFLNVSGFEFSDIQNTESPDFIVKWKNKKIGVEITEIFDTELYNGFNPRVIEKAQDHFLKCLEKYIVSPVPVEIWISFENKEPVPKTVDDVAKKLARYINEVVLADFEKRSVKFIIPRVISGKDINDRTIINSDVPAFIQRIQVLNDGHKKNYFTAGRGGILEDFSKKLLNQILDKKHIALKKYKSCDEHWLIMADRVSYAFDSNNNFTRRVSVANSFSQNDFETPVISNFDRVFRFSWPSEVFLLKS